MNTKRLIALGFKCEKTDKGSRDYMGPSFYGKTIPNGRGNEILFFVEELTDEEKTASRWVVDIPDYDIMTSVKNTADVVRWEELVRTMTKKELIEHITY